MTTSLKRFAFKYRSGDKSTIARDLDSLRENRFYAANRAALNDPFEGLFDQSAFDGQLQAIEELLKLRNTNIGGLGDVKSAANNLLALVDKSGIFSLSYNPLNELIWAHYGGSHKGFCIGYDIDKLVEFDPAQFHCIDVTYSDSAPLIQAADLLIDSSPVKILQKLLGTKSSSWRYEQEVRVIATPVGLHEYDFRAVKEIYFGLCCPQETRAAVMLSLAGRGITYKQVQSPHPSYRLEAEVISDIFASAPPYGINLAPIAAGSICSDHLKPELKQYSGYLMKAAEIVRREPYCKEVQLVDFSVSKSTPKNPVIYVQYQPTNRDRGVNHYLTLSEIDEQYKRLCGEHEKNS